MEAEADLVNYGKKQDLEEKIDKLMIDDEIEKELQNLKKSPSSEDKSNSES